MTPPSPQAEAKVVATNAAALARGDKMTAILPESTAPKGAAYVHAPIGGKALV